MFVMLCEASSLRLFGPCTLGSLRQRELCRLGDLVTTAAMLPCLFLRWDDVWYMSMTKNVISPERFSVLCFFCRFIAMQNFPVMSAVVGLEKSVTNCFYIC